MEVAEVLLCSSWVVEEGLPYLVEVALSNLPLAAEAFLLHFVVAWEVQGVDLVVEAEAFLAYEEEEALPSSEVDLPLDAFQASGAVASL